jgi:hypothetical protein
MLNSLVRSMRAASSTGQSQISSGALNGLPGLLLSLSNLARGGYEKDYINDLQGSFDAFEKQSLILTASPAEIKAKLQEHNENLKLHVTQLHRTLCFHLQLPTNLAEEVAHRASMLPRLSPSIILSRLSRATLTTLSEDWKKVIVQYGLAVAELQRAGRLLACVGNKADLVSELANPGHIDWDPMEYPDWLLLELENNILIRQEQAQIAKQMISPSSGRNSIMQLNMGLGKSSVIVPLVAAALADGTQIVRVVVLKSLSTQMFQLLLNKLYVTLREPSFPRQEYRELSIPHHPRDTKTLLFSLLMKHLLTAKPLVEA